MIKLTTTLMSSALDELNVEQQGILVDAYINPELIVSFHAYPNEDESGFKGTKIVTTHDAILVHEDAQEVARLIMRYKQNTSRFYSGETYNHGTAEKCPYCKGEGYVMR